VREALDPVFERLRTELRGILAGALPASRGRLRVRASHDLALSELARACAPQLDIEIDIQGAEDSLAGLARANASSPDSTSPTRCRAPRRPPRRSDNGSTRASTSWCIS
jgi:hypothetical protein